jgi:hypothetical protein
MKKIFWFVFAAMLLIELTGCASVQKKFTRKPKTPSHIPAAVYLQEGPYQKKFSNEYYYKTHFTLWKTWHSDLLNQLGGNQKKVSRCAQETRGHLTEMHRYLAPEEQAKLQPELDELNRICQRIESGRYSESQYGRTRTDLERIQRVVANNFYFDKVKAHLLPETVDLGAPAPAEDQGESPAPVQ